MKSNNASEFKDVPGEAYQGCVWPFEQNNKLPKITRWQATLTLLRCWKLAMIEPAESRYTMLVHLERWLRSLVEEQLTVTKVDTEKNEITFRREGK